MTSSKQYRCINCHKLFVTSTNHFGDIYGCSPCCGASAECAVKENGNVKAPEEFKQIKKGVRNMERMQTKTRIKGHEKFIVKYGFHYLQGNSRPYFSVTLDIWEKKRNGQWYESGGGSAHDEVARVFPELAPLIKWHLVGDDGTPMHYVANALYWLEMEFGISKWNNDSGAKPLEAFKRIVCFGALAEDIDESLSVLLSPLGKDAKFNLAVRVNKWCASRLPALAAKMKEDMATFGIEYIDRSEYMEGAA